MHHAYGQQSGTMSLPPAQQTIFYPLFIDPRRWYPKKRMGLPHKAAKERS